MGNAAFGYNGQLIISVVLFLELFSAAVALAILFADSFAILLKINPIILKIAFGAFMTPTTFSSIRGLGLISYVGVIGFLNLILIVVFDGIFGTYVPAQTNLWASSSADIGLAMGLIFVGLDIHSMVPGIAAAMETPQDFTKISAAAYLVALNLSLLMGYTGYYMFGYFVDPEISVSLAEQPGFEPSLVILTLLLIGINPCTKYALVLNNLILYIDFITN